MVPGTPESDDGSAVQLPVVGELYWVDPRIYADADQKDRRPVVVVRAPKNQLDRVHVITRTSDTSVPGVQHPADPSLELDKNGVFALKHYRRIEAVEFVPPDVELKGPLPEPYLGRVLDMWENS
jgi:mRNA-degrading endonuclease toxin of MazEF toxin-antitoxin module